MANEARRSIRSVDEEKRETKREGQLGLGRREEGEEERNEFGWMSGGGSWFKGDQNKTSFEGEVKRERGGRGERRRDATAFPRREKQEPKTETSVRRTIHI